MGCLALIFGETTYLGHIKHGQKFQLNRALAPLYVTKTLCIVVDSFEGNVGVGSDVADPKAWPGTCSVGHVECRVFG